MVLSRFWYLVLAVAIAAVGFLLYVAAGVSNHTADQLADRLLNAASVSVASYLKDDARDRADALIPLAVDADVGDALKRAAGAAALKEVDAKVRDKARSALDKFREAGGELGFDALWAIDVQGRVVASSNFERGTSAEGFEMGGYSLVADATHGFIRDDTWLFGDELWRVVARPAEVEVGGVPVGAIVGGKKVDDNYAREIVADARAPIIFYAAGKPLVRASPPSSDDHLLRALTAEDFAKLDKLPADDDYQKEGRSKALLVSRDASYDLRGVFSRLPGEARDLGAGYLVVQQNQRVAAPGDFYTLASDEDKKTAPWWLLALAAAGAALIGLMLSLFEHTAPLSAFKRALTDLADKNSKTDVLKPSTFRGAFRKLALLINDALDKVAAQGGVERGAADLSRVLGPMPSAPQMSAFAIPDKPGAHGSIPDVGPAPRNLPSVPEPPASQRSLPKAPAPKPAAPAAAGASVELSLESLTAESIPPEAADAAEAEPRAEPRAAPPPVPAAPAKKPPTPAAKKPAEEPAAAASGAGDEEAQWRKVYADFIALKKQLGEPFDKLTYDKFKGTLQRNKDALLAKGGVTRVAFRVYEKEGRAALKASPVK